MGFGFELKPVITLDEAAIAAAMSELWASIPKDPLAPDAIVGIATGGLECARYLTGSVGLPLLSCALRRPSTAAKSTPIARRLLARMPYAISDTLRRLEDCVLERKVAKRTEAAKTQFEPRNETLETDVARIAAEVRAKQWRHLVVIDDAVDSGATLSLIVAALRANLPSDTILTTAVLTQTRAQPDFIPDCALYHAILCRFPWSLDFRGQ